MLLSNKWQSSERQRMTAELWKIFLYCNINIAFTLPNLFWKWPKCCSLKIRKFQKYGAIQWLMGNVGAQIQTFYKGHEMFLKITQLYSTQTYYQYHTLDDSLSHWHKLDNFRDTQRTSTASAVKCYDATFLKSLLNGWSHIHVFHHSS